MIGSPDLVAFTKEADFHENGHDTFGLPEELSGLKYPSPEDVNPWSKISSGKFKKDFILLSEFSEQVGPQPLLTVPPESKAWGTFDLNHFSLRIMSVDYQTALAGSPGYSSTKLNFVEDSKVVLAESSEGVFAYVHHLTLYDLEARGFVRPFCLAYVSTDENKIIQQLLQLSVEFGKVSECLKTGNRKNFANELEIKLRDLEYTRVLMLRELEKELDNASVEWEGQSNGKLIPEGNREDAKPNDTFLSCEHEVKLMHNAYKSSGTGDYVHDSKSANHEQNGKESKDKKSCVNAQSNKDELPSVEKMIEDYKTLLKQITHYPIRKLREPEFSPYEPDEFPHFFETDFDSQVAGPESSGFTSLNSPLHSLQAIDSISSRFDKHLKTLEELCDDFFHQQALQQLYDIEKQFREDACVLHTQQICQKHLCNLKSTNFLFEDVLHNEADLKIGHYPVLQPSFIPPTRIPSEPVSIDSYTSCVEMVPIKLEFGGPSKRPSVLNNDYTQVDFQSLISVTSPEETDLEDLNTISTKGRQENMECCSTLMKTSISSGDSIEVLGTERSFKSQRSTTSVDSVLQRAPPISITTSLEGQKPGRVPTRRTCSEDSIEVLCTTESIRPEELRASYPCAIDEESQEQETDEKDCSEKQGESVEHNPEHQALETMDPQSIQATLTLTPPDYPVILMQNATSFPNPCTAKESVPQLLFEDACLTVPDDSSDCFSHQSITASTSSEFNFSTSLDQLQSRTRRRKGRVGRAALKFLRQFPFAVHAVFSLLSGRTLVVLGSEEAAVRQLVTALSMYMPHPRGCRESIHAWTSAPLQLSDLLNWKLIGFNR
ncbi:hypothetical protein DNTS_017108 [Danionella cerebrum]|uniref:UDENN FLCN/SMCR8-type domain-containing protein n=1 Tax=Danionella cerebrum TaxID=2873325 RepID=A0A553NG61_9TELE|nr:hypothetical protein DNTS_017108 [Danionella translucida]